jgi:hypothetical protein
MARAASGHGQSALEDRIRARRSELEQTALARIAAIPDPAATPDPIYIRGLRAALSTALDYGFEALVAPDREPDPVPVQLLSQARLAARNGVSLEAVLRRYAAGHSLLADLLLDEAAASGVAAGELKETMRALARRYDRVVAAISEEYSRETASQPRSADYRRYSLLRRLLAGEWLDASEFGYDFNAHHLAIVASGPGVADALGSLGRRLDRRLLLTAPDDRSAWAWLGGRRRFDSGELKLISLFAWPKGASLACGEPGEGLAGWRHSHHQAATALVVAERSAAMFVDYSDVALLAGVLQDDLLAVSLRQAYLMPLESDRDHGAGAKETLRAYFAARRNVSSAAAALGVNRRTVRARLSAIEARLGRSLDAASAELETALRLDQIDRGRCPGP